MEYPKSPFSPLVESELQILSGNPSYLSELLPWLCQTPKITTYRINLLRTSLESFKNRLQVLLSSKYKNPPIVYNLKNLPEIICIDPVEPLTTPLEPKPAKEVIVDVSCGAAVLRGAHIYAPGVMAMENGTKLGEEVLIYVDMAGKCKKGTSIRYESAGKLFLGVGVVRMQRHLLYAPPEKLCTGIAIEIQANISGVPGLGDLSCSDALLQNLPSIVCVRALSPQPNEIILDMCASPGNKTTHIAEMMGDVGKIIALDKTESKIQHICRKINLNSLQSIRPFVFDSTKSFNESVTEATTVELSPPFAANSFHRILLDAPCSALGNRPLLKAKITSNELKSFPRLQRKLFANAVGLLKPQGILVYSTCTVTEEENERIVEWALETYPNICLMDAVPKFGGPGLRNVGLSEQERHFVQRFGPAPTNADKNIDTVGFFIARFMKKA